MKRAAIYTLLAAGVIFNSCKKKDLPKSEVDGSPIFYANYEVNGTPVTTQAGVTNYYMNASHYQDPNNLYVYKAELKQSSCAGSCGYGISILINDYRFSGPNATMHADSALTPRIYPFGNGNSDPLSYTGVFLSPNVLATNSWHFSGDGTVYTSTQTTKQLDANTTYSVYLSSNDPAGCVTSHMNVFKVGNPLQTNVKAVYQGGQYTFSTDGITGVAPYFYQWDFGDGSPVSTLSSPSHNFSAQNLSSVHLIVTDAAKNTCDSYYQINGDNSCQANFLSSFTPVPNAKALSAVTIQITDPQGVMYSSADLTQSNSNFEIVSVENYSSNQQNEPTKKVKIKFSCSLTHAGNTLVITNGEAVIAVSYK